MTDLERELRKRYGDDLRQIRSGLWQLHVPEYRSDGDGVGIYISANNLDEIIVRDCAVTIGSWMDRGIPINDQGLLELAQRHGVHRTSGEFVVRCDLQMLDLAVRTLTQFQLAADELAARDATAHFN